MWNVSLHEQQLAKQSARDVFHLMAHHAYWEGKEEEAKILYQKVLGKQGEKLKEKQGVLPAHALLRQSVKLAMYAWRAKDRRYLDDLWERYGLAFAANSLELGAKKMLCLLAFLARQERHPQAQEALSALPEGCLERVLCESWQNKEKHAQAITMFASRLHECTSEEERVFPWDDEPLIACYERLQEEVGASWRDEPSEMP